jgi:hypothetical protein
VLITADAITDDSGPPPESTLCATREEWTPMNVNGRTGAWVTGCGLAGGVLSMVDGS